MGKQKHTPESWRLAAECKRGEIYVCRLTRSHPNERHPTEADAERIVACVNACAGIANPEAIREVVDVLRRAVEDRNDDCMIFGSASAYDAFIDAAEAALDKLRGES